VLREARNGLEQVKKGVVDYVSAGWDLSQIEDVPALLRAVRGALAMVPLERPADLLGRCAAYVDARLLTGGEPDWTALDTFADAVSGVDYYLERLCEEASLPSEDILMLVERSLDALDRGEPGPASHEAMEFAAGAGVGFSDEGEVPIAARPAVEAESSAADVPAPDDVDASQEAILREEPAAAGAEAAGAEATDDATQVVDRDDDDAAPDPVTIDDLEEAAFDLGGSLFDEVVEGESTAPEADEATQAEVEPIDADASFDLEADTIETPADEPLVTMTVDEQTFGADSVDLDVEPEAEPDVEPEVEQLDVEVSAAEHQPAVAAPTLVDDEDDEIMEIFVEEVGEVLESIEEWLPKWAADFSQEEALAEARRAFHTLKGSGRIVGASLIGELAWSVENMLNRVLDGSVEAHAEVAEVAGEASRAMPALRDAFHRRESADDDAVGHIIARAEQLAAGARLELDEASAQSPTEVAADAAAPVEISEASATDVEPSATDVEPSVTEVEPVPLSIDDASGDEAGAEVVVEHVQPGEPAAEETELAEIALQDDAETYALFEREALRYLETLEAHFATDVTRGARTAPGSRSVRFCPARDICAAQNDGRTGSGGYPGRRAGSVRSRGRASRGGHVRGTGCCLDVAEPRRRWRAHGCWCLSRRMARRRHESRHVV
jgi:chemosensory pili system protein ChpA (sensor histidine kinase/response regulator)